MAEIQGRRRPDLPIGDLHDDLRVGDYWKILTRDGSGPMLRTHSGKLTETCWHVIVPIPPLPYDDDGYGIANLQLHTVREHEDGTISVRPNDGSSNSILLSAHSGRSWHGFIEHGVLREA